ncbi:heavy metal translocating P-type ATPase [Pararhodospirillum oryzae]|uniref:P-type Zn(2+) transporter n=1 Tax=Pararhodospirillum oryzae TaxID=478448 RepID=A0A512H389_9PROT|nr:heavy metal translocating P-type ATPase [Pararhodospirillum oryzae]GEO79893.1 ATPase P [Pararhodospirillum oryzae]
MARLVHQIPGRSRFKMACLRDRRLDQRYLRGYLEGLEGVRRVRLNPNALSVVIEHDTTPTTAGRVEEAVRALDRTALPRTRDIDQGAPFSDTSPLVLGGLLCLAQPLIPRPVVATLTALHVSDTVRKGVATLLTEGLRVEVLDATAVGLATLRGEFGTANITQWLLNLAGLIEDSTRRASDDLVLRLLTPEVDTVWVEDEDGTVRAQPFATLEAGARLRVQAGETIAVDGLVVDGAATVNQSAVTGESLPVPREAGDLVLSGSVIEEGRLSIVAERVGDATTTARIAQFLQRALAEEAITQSKADELADRRILITLASGAAVFALTRSLRRLESVFLIDFSCAGKLGTSMAIKSAMVRAARLGALVKGGRALEKLAEADTIVFDKTGTLTHNELEVTRIQCLDATTCTSENALLALVASVAEHSRHPVSAAVVDVARKRRLEHIGHEEVDFFIGHGLATTVGDTTVRIGSRHYLEEHENIDFTPYEDILAELTARGGSLLFVGADGKPHGVIALRDRVRPEAREILGRLRASGITRLVMITGDTPDTAHALGEHLGLDEVHARIAPEDKARLIQTLQAQGRKVAYVGDGVNDAPALMVADVGLAMPRGADVARATADVVLMRDALDGVAHIHALARKTLGIIDKNFKAAATVNTGLLLAASAGRLAPVPAALLHNGTTLAVLGNAFLGGDFSREGLRLALADLRALADG